jgi:hypothetical protein
MEQTVSFFYSESSSECALGRDYQVSLFEDVQPYMERARLCLLGSGVAHSAAIVVGVENFHVRTLVQWTARAG